MSSEYSVFFVFWFDALDSSIDSCDRRRLRGVWDGELDVVVHIGDSTRCSIVSSNTAGNLNGN